jgi:hypothetical protein
MALVVHTWHPNWICEQQGVNVEYDNCMVVAEQAWHHTQAKNFHIPLNNNHKLPHKLTTSCLTERINNHKLTHKLNTSCPGMEIVKLNELNTDCKLGDSSEGGHTHKECHQLPLLE